MWTMANQTSPIVSQILLKIENMIKTLEGMKPTLEERQAHSARTPSRSNQVQPVNEATTTPDSPLLTTPTGQALSESSGSIIPHSGQPLQLQDNVSSEPNPRADNRVPNSIVDNTIEMVDVSQEADPSIGRALPERQQMVIINTSDSYYILDNKIADVCVNGGRTGEIQFCVDSNISERCLTPVCENDSVNVIYLFVTKMAFVGSWCYVQPLGIATKPPAKPLDGSLKILSVLNSYQLMTLLSIIVAAEESDAVIRPCVKGNCLHYLMIQTGKLVSEEESNFLPKLRLFGDLSFYVSMFDLAACCKRDGNDEMFKYDQLIRKVLATMANGKKVEVTTKFLEQDCCEMERITSEVCSFAGYWRMGNLSTVYDDNRIFDGDILLFTLSHQKSEDSYLLIIGTTQERCDALNFQHEDTGLVSGILACLCLYAFVYGYKRDIKAVTFRLVSGGKVMGRKNRVWMDQRDVHDRDHDKMSDIKGDMWVVGHLDDHFKMLIVNVGRETQVWDDYKWLTLIDDVDYIHGRRHKSLRSVSYKLDSGHNDELYGDIRVSNVGTSVKIKVDLCEDRGDLEWISPTVLGLQVMSNNEIYKDFLMANLQASHSISWSASYKFSYENSWMLGIQSCDLLIHFWGHLIIKVPKWQISVMADKQCMCPQHSLLQFSSNHYGSVLLFSYLTIVHNIRGYRWVEICDYFQVNNYGLAIERSRKEFKGSLNRCYWISKVIRIEVFKYKKKHKESIMIGSDEWSSTYFNFLVELEDGPEPFLRDSRRLVRVPLLQDSVYAHILELVPDAFMEPIVLDAFCQMAD
ncbi:hypothetical protein QQ045_021515 [Rhodiola kirilowii]